MHLSWDVNIGNLVTWALSVGGALVAVGRMSQVLIYLGTSLQELKDQFKVHVESDERHQESIQQTIHQLFLKS